MKFLNMIQKCKTKTKNNINTRTYTFVPIPAYVSHALRDEIKQKKTKKGMYRILLMRRPRGICWNIEKMVTLAVKPIDIFLEC